MCGLGPAGEPSTLAWNIAAEKMHHDDPTGAEALDIAKEWIGKCLTSHEYCDAHGASPLPERVLELTPDLIFLREYVKPPVQRYACLSHYWGPRGPAVQLKKETSASLRQGMPVDSLPKTFSDSVKVCLRLGISFLWIDALCIYQDDLNDWEQAAATMASIYERAHITIAAACARDSTDGLRPLAAIFKEKLVPSTGLCVRRHYRELTDQLNLSRNDFPLLWRAWVFQERSLSPRILYFSACRLVWECRTVQHIESKARAHQWSYDHVILGLQSLTREPPDVIAAWQSAVEQFSRLGLTYGSDKLPSIAALASRMEQYRKQDTYLGGLWWSSLLYDLQWVVFSHQARCNSNAPTWSWASVNGEVQFERRGIEPYVLPSVTLLDVVYRSMSSAFVGRATEARISLEGHTSKVTRKGFASRHLDDPFELSNLNGLDIGIMSFTDIDPDTDSRSGSPDEDLIVFFLTKRTNLVCGYSGPILRKLHDNIFQRVGWLRASRPFGCPVLSSTDPDFWAPLDAYMAKSPLEVVTIV
ncbi:heterokaryon incompatibility protein-domain-containing protein [Boeremia exigua]|uniref:heterokaryon incompatibility protein-domain-containing protein n=1 Tax=Boeremia exigua TaxID=749465 RepID=UPI001E8E5AB2|nr:heterokaryon incompatibility protein-domain-containing protein [Boeremia exigua]KAH6622067.1 heterokaryon incompatibility protein-domain-containing protein [Boeremia exigua]